MDKLNDALIASTFDKIKQVDIFAFKAYMERTKGVETSVSVVLVDIFVNLPFFLLNLIVGFFSIILRFFETFSLYDSYKQSVFDTSQTLWKNVSGVGDYQNSLLYLLIAISAFSILITYFISRGDFAKRLVHLFVVILLGMGYFGTIQKTSGGIYVLDTVHQLADSFSDSVTQLTVTDPKNSQKKLSHHSSVADDYIMRTSYATYLYVNTGQLNGYFHNNQTGKDEILDNSKILGKRDKSGNFHQLKTKEVLDYVDGLGNDALEGREQNRWVSAVNDYLWLKSLYVIFKIIEAVIIAIPLLLIQLMAFLADIMIIVMMFLFPLGLIISFIPRMQMIVFNLTKVMLGAATFPALTGFLTLIVFYVQSLISAFIKSKFQDGQLLSSSSLQAQSILFILVITVVVQGVVFWAIWKYKEQLLTLMLGQKTAQVVNRSADTIVEKADTLKAVPHSIYEKAQDFSYQAMMLAGYHRHDAQDNWNGSDDVEAVSFKETLPRDSEDTLDESVEQSPMRQSDDSIVDETYSPKSDLELKSTVDPILSKNNYETIVMKESVDDSQSVFSDLEPEGAVFEEEPGIDSPVVFSENASREVYERQDTLLTTDDGSSRSHHTVPQSSFLKELEKLRGKA